MCKLSCYSQTVFLKKTVHIRNVPWSELYLEKEQTFFYFSDEAQGAQETNMAYIFKSFSLYEKFYVCAIQNKSILL
jgi:hypothetical protein